MIPEYINAHEPICNYLIHYFLPDISDPHFRPDAAQEIEQDERITYCRYMAAWLPHELHYDEIQNRIAGAAQCANNKEDAVEHPLFSYLCALSTCGHVLGTARDRPKHSPGSILVTLLPFFFKDSHCISRKTIY